MTNLQTLCSSNTFPKADSSLSTVQALQLVVSYCLRVEADCRSVGAFDLNTCPKLALKGKSSRPNTYTETHTLCISGESKANQIVSQEPERV